MSIYGDCTLTARARIRTEINRFTVREANHCTAEAGVWFDILKC